MQAKRHLKRGGIGLILMGMAGLAIAIYMRQGLLLPRARRITGVSNYAHGFDYLWLSDQQIVFVMVPSREVVTFDANNGREISRMQFDPRGDDLRLPLGLKSPDGKWLLKRGHRSPTTAPLIAVSVDGGRQIQWQYHSNQILLSPRWMPDSLHWVQTFEGADTRGSYRGGGLFIV